MPTKNNLLGVKGGGEGATVSATAAFVNAVCDALAAYVSRSRHASNTRKHLARDKCCRNG